MFLVCFLGWRVGVRWLVSCVGRVVGLCGCVDLCS